MTIMQKTIKKSNLKDCIKEKSTLSYKKKTGINKKDEIYSFIFNTLYWQRFCISSNSNIFSNIWPTFNKFNM